MHGQRSTRLQGASARNRCHRLETRRAPGLRSSRTFFKRLQGLTVPGHSHPQFHMMRCRRRPRRRIERASPRNRVQVKDGNPLLALHPGLHLAQCASGAGRGRCSANARRRTRTVLLAATVKSRRSGPATTLRAICWIDRCMFRNRSQARSQLLAERQGQQFAYPRLHLTERPCFR